MAQSSSDGFGALCETVAGKGMYTSSLHSEVLFRKFRKLLLSTVFIEVVKLLRDDADEAVVKWAALGGNSLFDNAKIIITTSPAEGEISVANAATTHNSR